MESKRRRRNPIVIENMQDGMGNEGMATRLVQGNLCTETGDKKECSNSRKINLIVQASKVILKIIIKRINKKYREEKSKEQEGFVEDKRTRDQIVNIRNIMEIVRTTIFQYIYVLLIMQRHLTV